VIIHFKGEGTKKIPALKVNRKRPLVLLIEVLWEFIDFFTSQSFTLSET
jgi:hypothetical protein